MLARATLALFLLLSVPIKAQLTITDILDMFNNNTVKYISAEELKNHSNITLLDAREYEEYEVSHLKNAIWAGYDNFEVDRVLREVPNKETELVVYCSVGIRSEDIGEKLLAAGYTNLRNLYGGIFEWKNKGYPVYNSHGQNTEIVHAYSKYWASLLTNAQHVYTSKTETIGQEKQ